MTFIDSCVPGPLFPVPNHIVRSVGRGRYSLTTLAWKFTTTEHMQGSTNDEKGKAKNQKMIPIFLSHIITLTKTTKKPQ